MAAGNEFGGDMGQTCGASVEDIAEGIRHGVRKVNIDADLCMASSGAALPGAESQGLRTARFLAASTKAMKEICVARYEAFACAGQAGKIKHISLGAMGQA